MAQITANNNGSLKELMAQGLVDLKTESKYLTGKIKGGSGLDVVTANNRGFVVALDYTTNGSFGYMNPDGGNLVTPTTPALDRMTANLQYIQLGQEISNLQIANSNPAVKVGASAKALAARKLLERRAEMEEFYFCRGDGNQTLADITGSVTAVLSTQVTVATSGSRDGMGSYFLRPNQRVRIYTSAMVFKSSGYVSAKTTNASFGYTATAITTAGIVDTDVVLPESDSTTPTTTGVKGLPYLVKASGAFFDKTLSTTPALQAVIDSSTTTPSRTTLQYLYNQHKLRTGGKGKTTATISRAQHSNYFTQFYAQHTPAVNIVGQQGRPAIDLGADSEEFTFWGQKIEVFDFLHPKNWWNLDYGSFSRLTLKEAGEMIVPAGQFVQKISSGVYANAQQSWDDDYLEYLSTTPHMNSGMTALTFSGLPLLVNSPYVG